MNFNVCDAEFVVSSRKMFTPMNSRRSSKKPCSSRWDVFWGKGSGLQGRIFNF